MDYFLSVFFLRIPQIQFFFLRFFVRLDLLACLTSMNSLLSGKKIFWVEDDDFLSSLIAQRLSTEGCELHHARNGDEALKMLSNLKPDIIILDLLLPGLSGFDLLEAIRAMPNQQKTPVIILSNLGQKADLDKGLALGASKYLIKATTSLDDILAEIVKTLS